VVSCRIIETQSKISNGTDFSTAGTIKSNSVFLCYFSYFIYLFYISLDYLISLNIYSKENKTRLLKLKNLLEGPLHVSFKKSENCYYVCFILSYYHSFMIFLCLQVSIEILCFMYGIVTFICMT
jgi:hypothetical protein